MKGMGTYPVSIVLRHFSHTQHTNTHVRLRCGKKATTTKLIYVKLSIFNKIIILPFFTRFRFIFFVAHISPNIFILLRACMEFHKHANKQWREILKRKYRQSRCYHVIHFSRLIALYFSLATFRIPWSKRTFNLATEHTYIYGVTKNASHFINSPKFHYMCATYS